VDVWEEVWGEGFSRLKQFLEMIKKF